MVKVLIIEDDKFLSRIYATKLNKEGIEADFSLNGEEGLKKMKEISPTLVLLDLIMPKLDGFSVLEAIQKDSSLKKIPVIVLSNLGQEEDVKKAKLLGAKDFIVKSDASIQDVVAKIKSYIQATARF